MKKIKSFFGYMHVAILILLAVFSTAGCGSGNRREAVSGTVTLNGKALESGTISFRPIDSETGNNSGGSIKNGEFEIWAANGLLPGEYAVSIQAFQSTGKMVNDPQMGMIEEIVPVFFQESNLKATVSSSELNRFEFNLTVK